MSKDEKEKIAKMDWGEFEGKLQTTATRAAGGGGSDEKAMRAYFGDEEFEELKALAQRAKTTRAKPEAKKGNIVFLPGIMGSNLMARENRVSDYLVWVDLINIVRGRASWLRLSDDGKKELDSAYEVRASLIDKRTYSRAILSLGARWNVEPFAFDWRKDLDEAAHALNKFIKEKFIDNPEHEDKPLHLVAHSMGGLVCRNFIHLHKDTWQKMRGNGNGDGAQYGRLIMMGTPNYGSFAIPQVMTGDEKQVRWLSVADLEHTLDEILAIINTFVGSYQMLPDPEKAPEIKELYKRENWGKFPVSDTHLTRSLAFHRQLQDPATINPERMRYIAG
jgi:pimeloyl-ACP methyl ester carboxylesterase